MEKILGTFSFSVMYNESNGYSVNIYKLKNKQKVTVIGFFLPTNKLTYEFTGEYITHEKYGKQFKADMYTEHIEDTEESVITYLSSGLIKGIGKKTAERIWKMFGENTMNVLKNSPEDLLYIKGISTSKLEDIIQSYNALSTKEELLRFLLPYGISPKVIYKIHETLSGNAIEKIKENPYVLCEIENIGFDTADTLASKMYIDVNDDRRIEACMIHCLKLNEINGCLSMDKDDFGEKVVQKLRLKSNYSEKVCLKTIEMIKEKKLLYKRFKDDENKEHYQIFIPSRYQVENDIAKRLIELKNQPKNHYADIDKKLERICRKNGIIPDFSQLNAIKTALREPVSVIAGGPGCGKTTIEKIIIQFLEEECDSEICLMAPTGRAARRMAEVTKKAASTIHSRLKIYDSGVNTNSSSEEDVEFANDEVIIVDEFSMVDIWVMHKIMKAIKDGCKFILVGDPNQLPSVGPGAVLRDIILSKVIPVSLLQIVHRQSEDSVIYENCENIGDGITEMLEGKDFHYYEISDIQEIEDKMVENTVNYVKKYGQENVICLCPYKEHVAGVNRMNSKLQATLNPPDNDKEQVEYGDIIYRTGDIVMHLKNQENLSNGDIGFIYDIRLNEDNQKVIVVKYTDTYMEYTPEDYKLLQMAYASTIHKVQGCEYKAIVSCLCKHQTKMRKRKLLLTAISRGKVEVSFYTDSWSIVEEAITNINDIDRGTMLWWHLRYYDGQFVQSTG